MVAGIIRAAILGVLAVPLVGFAAGMAARNVEWVDADPELRAAAVEAAGFAWISCVENPIQRLYTLKVTVDSVEPVARCLRSVADGYGPGYRSVVRERSFFGVVIRTDIVLCGSSSCAQGG